MKRELIETRTVYPAMMLFLAIGIPTQSQAVEYPPLEPDAPAAAPPPAAAPAPVAPQRAPAMPQYAPPTYNTSPPPAYQRPAPPAYGGYGQQPYPPQPYYGYPNYRPAPGGPGNIWGGRNFNFMPWGNWGNPGSFFGGGPNWNNRQGGWGPFPRGPKAWFNSNPEDGMAAMYDDMLEAPSEMGDMPGGWSFPSISTPNPVDVADQFGEASKDFSREAPDMIRSW